MVLQLTDIPFEWREAVAEFFTLRDDRRACAAAQYEETMENAKETGAARIAKANEQIALAAQEYDETKYKAVAWREENYDYIDTLLNAALSRALPPEVFKNLTHKKK